MKSNVSLAGVDVSKTKLDVCARVRGQERTGQFSNDAEGHRAFVRWFGKKGRVCVEATGAHHLPFCLALRAAGIEVMVINPRQSRNYAASQNVRSKTDRIDAGVMLQYLERSPFRAWEAPSREILALRDVSRRMDDLTEMMADEKKRRHDFANARLASVLTKDVDINVRHLKRRIDLLHKEALELIHGSEVLTAKFKSLLSVRGVGARTAIHLLAELLMLDPTMTTREIVAYAGLDPREHQSGNTRKPARISRVGNARLRAKLYLPAVTCIRHDAAARAFRDRLQGRGKHGMQAVVAIMRKLLHAIWTLLQRGGTYDSARLFPLDTAALSGIGQNSVMAESTDSAIPSKQRMTKKSHPKGRSEAKERQLDSSSSSAIAAA